MKAGQCLISKNSKYTACLQRDGNFVVHKKNAGNLSKQWKKIPGSGMNIDVDVVGNAFGQNKFGAMYKYDGSKWNKIYGGA